MDEGAAKVKELKRYVDLASKATFAPKASEVRARLDRIPRDVLEHCSVQYACLVESMAMRCSPW